MKPLDISAPRSMVGERRTPSLGLLRVGVLGCVVFATVLGMAGLYVSVVAFARDAGQYAALDDLDREYGDWRGQPLTIRDRTVVERALVLIPEDASYRVLIGDDWRPLRTTRWSDSLERDFLKYYLLPRQLSESQTTSWVFCLRCDTSTVGPASAVARSADGLSLLRTTTG